MTRCTAWLFFVSAKAFACATIKQAAHRESASRSTYFRLENFPHSNIGRKLTRMLAVLCACGVVSTASAGLLIYEPFDYTAGSGSTIVPGSTSINSGNGLVDNYGPNAPTTWVEAGSFTSGTTPHQITSPGLTAPTGFPSNIGNAAAMIGGASGRSDFKEMGRMNLPGGPYNPGASVTPLYYSLLLKVSDLTGLTTLHTNANANNDLIIGFNNVTGTLGTTPNTWADELTIRLGSDSSHYNLGIRASTTAANTTFWEPTDYSTNDTLLIVTRWTEGSTAGSGGLSEIWVNPSSSSFGAASAPGADGSTVGTFSASGANDHTNSILIGAGIAAGSNPNEIDIDEIRVGTDWASVTIPEPSTCCLALVLCAALSSLRQNYFRRA